MRQDNGKLGIRRRAHWAAAGIVSITAVVLIIAVATVVIPLLTGEW